MDGVAQLRSKALGQSQPNTESTSAEGYNSPREMKAVHLTLKMRQPDCRHVLRGFVTIAHIIMARIGNATIQDLNSLLNNYLRVG